MSESETTTTTKVRYGFFPIVSADEVRVRQAGVTAALSAGDMTMTQGGGQLAVVGGNLSITQGGSNALLCGGDVQISQGGAVVMAAKAISVRRGFVGVAVGGSVKVEDGKVLMTTPQAAAFGAALGFVLALIGRLLRR